MMKIEVGKFYKDGDGDKVFILYRIKDSDITWINENHIADTYMFDFIAVGEDGTLNQYDEEGKNLHNRINQDLIEEWHAEPVKPMINGIQVKVGQWWEMKTENVRVKINFIYEDGMTDGNFFSFCLKGKYLNKFGVHIPEFDIVKLIEDVE